MWIHKQGGQPQLQNTLGPDIGDERGRPQPTAGARFDEPAGVLQGAGTLPFALWRRRDGQAGRLNIDQLNDYRPACGCCGISRPDGTRRPRWDF
jgi:hypothetical protein